MSDQLSHRRGRPTPAQRAYLRRGMDQPGWKLPLFDEQGQRYSLRTIRSCIDQGWAEPWFDNPIKPNWLVCRLTKDGYGIVNERRKRPVNPAALLREQIKELQQ